MSLKNNKPIRILQCFGRMHTGGAETMLMNIYRNIDRSIIQFDFLVHTDVKQEYDDEILSLGGQIYRIPRYRVYNHYDYLRSLRKFFETNDLDQWKAIHGHIESTASIYLRMAKKYGLTTIAHSHTTSNGPGLKGKVKDYLSKDIKKYADIKIACSNNAGKWMFGDDSDNVIVLRNGIDVFKFKYDYQLRNHYRDLLGLNGFTVYGHVGNFITAKNHMFLLDVFNQIYLKNNNTRLVLVGEGELRCEIEKKIEKLSLDNVVLLLGKRPDVNGILNSFDFFIFPSIFEGVPLSVVEAQTNGLKVICSSDVDSEVKVTDNIEFLDLSEGSEYWADFILNIDEYVREDMTREVIEKGYDSLTNAKVLEKVYLSI